MSDGYVGRHDLRPQNNELRQSISRLDSADSYKRPSVGVAPGSQDRAFGVSRLWILAVCIQRIKAEDWHLID
jgi:uncharacterized protein YlxP (DUF503 family)